MLEGIKKLNAGKSLSRFGWSDVVVPHVERFPSFQLLPMSLASIDNTRTEKEVYQAGGHGGVVRTAPGMKYRGVRLSGLGLVKKKTVSQEITFYKDFGSLSLEKMPPHIRPFFPKFHHASKSTWLKFLISNFVRSYCNRGFDVWIYLSLYHGCQDGHKNCW